MEVYDPKFTEQEKSYLEEQQIKVLTVNEVRGAELFLIKMANNELICHYIEVIKTPIITFTVLSAT